MYAPGIDTTPLIKLANRFYGPARDAEGEMRPVLSGVWGTRPGLIAHANPEASPDSDLGSDFTRQTPLQFPCTTNGLSSAALTSSHRRATS